MLQTISVCPYCRAVIAFDPEGRRTVFDPDRPASGPCSHLACYWICFAVDDAGDSGPSLSHSRLWEIDRGEYAVDGRLHPDHASLTRYLCDYGFKNLPANLVPNSDHRIAGASAQEREERRPGTGEMTVVLDGRYRTAILDGWALFAPQPLNVCRQIRSLAHEYEI